MIVHYTCVFRSFRFKLGHTIYNGSRMCGLLLLVSCKYRKCAVQMSVNTVRNQEKFSCIERDIDIRQSCRKLSLSKSVTFVCDIQFVVSRNFF